MRLAAAIGAFFAGLRLLLRDLAYKLGAERRQRRLGELDEVLSWAYAHRFTLEQTIVLARYLGYRRHARMLEALRQGAVEPPRLPSPRR